ncbi:putative S-adenosylmethionine-dependent methyltransferase/MSMEI_2290 [Methylobacterium brachiatum]|jgi:2-polyprenyl-3-methyl-5-hydroxy-6-metoxy-1,4-benzoquinol methylase|nr:putative S-adenosylmethionine-dependent methyltransferase/MSMEI_2290 [Methylobacterium brachiatum]
MKLFRLPNNSDISKFTGERYVAGIRGEIEFEHYHRYLFASQFCAGARVLDIASGDGYGSFIISQVAEQVLGVDVDFETVRNSIKEYSSNNLKFVQGKCDSLPVERESFDVVLSFETLEHVEEQEAFLAEIRRALKPGGIAVISTPDRETYSPEGITHNQFHLKELSSGEFFDLVSKYFPFLVKANQKATSCSIIYGEAANASAPEIFSKSDRENVISEDGIYRFVYSIAILSDGPIGPVRWGLFEDDRFTHEQRAELWAASDHIRELSAQINENRAILNGMGAEVCALEKDNAVEKSEIIRSQHFRELESAVVVNRCGSQDDCLPRMGTGLLLSQTAVDQLMQNLRLNEGIASAHNIEVLKGLTLEEREEFAFRSNTMVLYLGEEVEKVQSAEERAALYAVPAGYDLPELNGLNVGCGDRLVSKYIQPVDVMRRAPPGCSIPGVHHALTDNALLALPDNLPFMDNSIDFIIALHMLEHVEEPVSVINHWLDKIKPGGGIGIVVPDWRYTWDSRNDGAPFGHKWNPTPKLLYSLHDKYWSARSSLERLSTYPYRISFDFIIRKHGVFTPFSTPDHSRMRSGQQRHKLGKFLQGD